MPKVSDAHLEARRRQILDAAARCFARDGFHRTSMQDIVRESAVSAGLVYVYFASKDDMIAAIVAEWHEARQGLITSDGDFAATYLGLLRSVGEPHAAEELRLGVQVWAEAVRTPEIRDLVRRGVDGPRGTAAELIRRLQADGGLDASLDPDGLARILIAIYQGLALQTVWDDTVDNDAFVGTVGAILDTLLS